ncbi:hypothetical protein RFI_03353 [Reticulomyxa filosa]|uniref:Ribosomal RNA methyltransferase FtsJ domain-containing protein n=1 Tax=Reticulomyxa filosa TaxID=46433 RepID=X6P6L1_RETFI|nr:hypothetical protein RFI_03353 [Reticulomyxa filosa]|eukprot:ETO33748.1 hypothetical protein RFI_03353 [Reticulomyxa filosa]
MAFGNLKKKKKELTIIVEWVSFVLLANGLFLLYFVHLCLDNEKDVYYRRAKEVGFRARSAFKLIQLDQQFRLLEGVKRAVDLCAAPGSWSQVLSRRLQAHKDKTAKIVAVDLQPMAPIQGVIQIQGDITNQDTATEIIKHFDGEKADIVISDGAPDASILLFVYVCVCVCVILLLLLSIVENKKGGTFIAKIFRGRDIGLLYEKLQIFFTEIVVAKPKSSRNSSIEAFVVCRDYSPPRDYVPTMAPILFNEKSHMDNDQSNGLYRYTIQFVACGDQSSYDADSSYPLQYEHDDNLGANEDNENENDDADEFMNDDEFLHLFVRLFYVLCFKYKDDIGGDNQLSRKPKYEKKGYQYTEPVQPSNRSQLQRISQTQTNTNVVIDS